MGGNLTGSAITVALGESAICTLTNDDDTVSLTLNKVVSNDNGGTAVAADWTLDAAGPTPLNGPGPSVSSPEDFKAGSYVLSESNGPDGYTASAWVCDGGSLDGEALTLALGESASCTITNDDDTVNLTLIKEVTNNNGGTAVPADWNLDAAGPTPFNGPGPSVSSPENFEAGSYILTESTGHDGYTASSWVCDGGSLEADTITLALGESATCTITNDDDTVGLTLNKVVSNDNGGVAVPADWTLNAAGPTPLSGPGPSISSPEDFEAGSYFLSESNGPDGYTASTWVCDGGSLEIDTITLALGESATCTITNDDDQAGLTLVKVVTNDNEGEAVASDWTLIAAGPTPLSGPGPSVSSGENFEPGSYDLSETDGPNGYIASDWVCDGGSLDGDTLTLALGESATCTITNDDDGIGEVIFANGFE